jgi:hypothetical protein
MDYLFALVFLACNNGTDCIPNSVALYKTAAACSAARDLIQEDEETACVIILPEIKE